MLKPKEAANLVVGISLVAISVIATNTILKTHQAIPTIPAGKVLNEGVRNNPVPLSLPLKESIVVETSALKTTKPPTAVAIRAEVPVTPVEPPTTEDAPITRSGFALPIMYPTTEFRYNLILEGNPTMPWNDLAFQHDVQSFNDKFPVTIWKKDKYGNVTKLDRVQVPSTRGMLVYGIKGIVEGDIVYLEYTPALYSSPFASVIDNVSNDPVTFSLIPVRFVTN